MKPFIVTLLLVFPCLATDLKPATRLAQIDLELTLQQYKETRTEQFKSEMQLKLLQTDESRSSRGMQKTQRLRLEDRMRILQNMADELRAKAIQMERETLERSNQKETDVRTSRSGAAAMSEGDLRKRMLGTWQLVSFADGRVSEANEGELKFIGDRHWSVSRLNPRTGRLDYHMGGTYTLNEDEYVETIEYGTGGPIGETYTYKLSVAGDKFTQIGVGNPWSLVFERAK